MRCMQGQGVIKVKQEHIQRGLEKYQGQPDEHLNGILARAGFQYSVYRFADGRILLVLPHEIAAFLYQNEQHLFQTLELDA